MSSSPHLRLAALLIGLLLVGCSQGARSLKLDQDLARKSFEAFLTAWRDGQTPQDLQKRDPKIIGTDAEWQRGRKLKNFEVLPEEFNDGTNLKLSAKLTLELDKNRIETRVVEYIVGTSPVITVFPP